jgi:hypothetical protein
LSNFVTIPRENSEKKSKALNFFRFGDCTQNDIEAHNFDPEKIVLRVRNWISDNVRKNIRSATKIWQRYNKFLASFESSAKDEGFTKEDIDEMPVAEFIYFIKSWTEANP